jgi:hypothetical protein
VRRSWGGKWNRLPVKDPLMRRYINCSPVCGGAPAFPPGRLFPQAARFLIIHQYPEPVLSPCARDTSTRTRCTSLCRDPARFREYDERALPQKSPQQAADHPRIPCSGNSFAFRFPARAVLVTGMTGRNNLWKWQGRLPGRTRTAIRPGALYLP